MSIIEIQQLTGLNVMAICGLGILATAIAFKVTKSILSFIFAILIIVFLMAHLGLF